MGFSNFIVADIRISKNICNFAIMTKWKIILCLTLMLHAGFDEVTAAEINDSVAVDSLEHKPVKKHKISKLRRIIRGFSYIDTAYIEPQAYIYTVMLQNTNTFEIYHISDRSGQEVVFSPKPSYKLGPYIGWRWVFLGYTIDLTHLNGSARQDINLSVYSNQIGFDLFWRKSGDAYPAAYSQSTIQRRSQGSPLAGFGYTRHKLDINWEKFYDLANERLGEGYLNDAIDTTLQRSQVDYTDFSMSGGYAYNWVFARNWLFDISLQMAVAYKHSKSDASKQKRGVFREFSFSNFNLDGITRIGIVWNTMRWYAGANAIFHAYNYRKSQFKTNNVFGNVNFYFGYNFGSIHKKKKNKKTK